jgi:hypothetical protein
MSNEKLNVKQAATRRAKAQEGALKMRNMLWPDLDESKLWLRKNKKGEYAKKGFTTLPRTMPLLMNLINDLSKSVNPGKSVPAGKAYLGLWCRVFDEGMVKIDNEAALAFEAGYTGERNVTTWREHMRVLKELGFIDYKEGPSGPCQYVLIFNPYHAVMALKGQIQPASFTALYQRAVEVGADEDMNAS